MSLEDLLQGMLGGGTVQPSGQAGGDPLAGLLEGLLGGGRGAAGQAGGLGGLLEGILGGAGASGAASGQGGLGDILGAILGGGAGETQAPDMSPIVDGVASKMNLPSAIIQMIVAFVLSKLIGGLGSGAAAMPGLEGYGRGSLEPGQPSEEAAPAGPSLDGLLQQMSGDEGLAQELAQQTGLDPATAMQGIQEVIGQLGSGRPGAQADQVRPTQGGLDNMLQSW